MLSFDESYEGFVCGPSEMTRPGDDPHHCRVHTLEEVLATLRDHPDVPSDFIVYVELKGPGTAIPVVELVERLDVGRMCRYSSFDHSRIAEVREMDQRAVTGALFSGRVPDDFVDAAIAVRANEIHLRYDACTYERVREAHRAGLNTMAWFRGPSGMREDCSTKYFDVGNEDASMYRTVLRSGVGSMCVNRPDVMVKVLEGMAK
jgi:glycerophosphoryl diester phosphodiesterase